VLEERNTAAKSFRVIVERPGDNRRQAAVDENVIVVRFVRAPTEEAFASA
jgi:hypothetical protein